MADLKQRHKALKNDDSTSAQEPEHPLQPQPQQQSTTTTTTNTNTNNNNKPTHPPGYNKRKRDIVKLVLVVVAACLLRGDPKVATIVSVVAIVSLKEGTFWSAKNLKWMALCIMSFAMSLASWSLERASDDVNEEKAYTLNSILWVSAKIIQLCWGMTLSVFLVSAYVHGHNSLLEFDFLNDHGHASLPPPGPRKDPPPKTYLLY